MKRSILICDDDSGIIDVVSIILSQSGYSITTLTDSEKVIEFAKANKPDLIMLDLWMPSISGEELTIQLKHDLDTKDIPIIIFSASKDTEKVALKAGADDYIVKPFDIDDLESLVEKHIG